MITVIDALPDLVRQNRERRGISQRELGELVGVTGQTIYMIEHGQSNCSKTMLANLLRWLADGR